jgi:hypothetical protein
VWRGTTGDGADDRQKGYDQRGLGGDHDHGGQKFDLSTFDDGETVEDYALHLRGMVVHLIMLDEEVKDGEFIVKML